MVDLSGKVALITGAGQGVGQGIALALARAGATIAVTGRTEAKLLETCRIIAERGGSAIPIAQREEDARFTSKFITADPSIKSLSDLKGKTFAFGSPSSTSGSLMPRFFMQQAGLNIDKDFKNIAFSGAHDATAAFVSAGKADAGVLNASVWDKLVEQKKIDTDKVRVFATTPPFFDYNWTVRGDLDPKLIKQLTEAFLKLDPNNPEHKEILTLQRASRFIPTRKENYDGIEKAAISAGLLK